MKNPKIPAIRFNTRFIVTSKEWFGAEWTLHQAIKISGKVKLFMMASEEFVTK